MRCKLRSLCVFSLAGTFLLSGCAPDPSPPKIRGGVGVLYGKEWESSLSLGVEKDLSKHVGIGVELAAHKR